MTSPCLMHETEYSKPVHWDNPEGWNGKGGRRGVQDGGGGGTCTPVADSCQCMAKTSTVRKHLTGGFLCAILDLSGILCSLLRIKRRGCLQASPGG